MASVMVCALPNRHAFWKVLYIVPLHINYTRALTFENLRIVKQQLLDERQRLTSANMKMAARVDNMAVELKRLEIERNEFSNVNTILTFQSKYTSTLIF